LTLRSATCYPRINLQAPPPTGGASGYDSPERAIARVPGFFFFTVEQKDES
jgi:hypothetical protein